MRTAGDRFDLIVIGTLALLAAVAILAGRDSAPRTPPGPCAQWADVSPTSYGACLQKEGVK